MKKPIPIKNFKIKTAYYSETEETSSNNPLKKEEVASLTSSDLFLVFWFLMMLS